MNKDEASNKEEFWVIMDRRKAVNFARGFLQKAENDFMVAKEYLEKCNKSIGDRFYKKCGKGSRGTYVLARFLQLVTNTCPESF